jgi:putative PIN family toxin of toxin-antitoxin system
MAARAARKLVLSATLDSNVYVSALQFGGAGVWLLWLARAGKIRLDTSDAILDETTGVLRDKFGWEGYRLHFAKLQLQNVVNRVQPTRTIEVAEDPDDNRILECAAEAGSDLIVTNDRDLLRLGSHEGRPIVRAAHFLSSYGPR